MSKFEKEIKVLYKANLYRIKILEKAIIEYKKHDDFENAMKSSIKRYQYILMTNSLKEILDKYQI